MSGADTSLRPAVLLAAAAAGPSIRVLDILPDGGSEPFAPGSHVDLGFEIGGATAKRSYSLLPGAPQGACRIAVKRVTPGRGGSAALCTLPIGAKLLIGRPVNNFPLFLDSPDVLLIAGGIGITPLIAMADAVARSGARYRLIYAARQRSDLLWPADLAARHGPKIEFFLSAEGRYADLAAEIAVLPPDGSVYFCGPHPMLAALRRAWSEAGRPEALLRFETFGAGGGSAEASFWVRVPGRERRIEVPPGRTILEALEAEGIEMMSDCRRGACGLCAVPVTALDGRIDHRDIFLSERQKRTDEKLCVCVSRIVGGGVAIDTAFRADL